MAILAWDEWELILLMNMNPDSIFCVVPHNSPSQAQYFSCVSTWNYFSLMSYIDTCQYWLVAEEPKCKNAPNSHQCKADAKLQHSGILSHQPKLLQVPVISSLEPKHAAWKDQNPKQYEPITTAISVTVKNENWWIVSNLWESTQVKTPNLWNPTLKYPAILPGDVLESLHELTASDFW